MSIRSVIRLLPTISNTWRVSALSYPSQPELLCCFEGCRACRRGRVLYFVQPYRPTLFILTWRQCGMYIDASTLWQTTIERNPQAWMAHENLGALYLESGRLEDAIEQFYKTLAIKADDASAEANLGNVFLQMGQLDEAIIYYEKALELKTDSAEVQYNLGNAFLRKGEFDEAVSHYKRALDQNRFLALRLAFLLAKRTLS
jgi:tetratricopeptide (TPR) repeat protein